MMKSIRNITQVLSVILAVTFWNIQGTVAQFGSQCQAFTSDGTTGTPIFSFPWLPSQMQTLNFEVNTRDSTEIEIFLSPEPAVVTEMYVINIGGDVPDGQGDADDGDVDAAIYRSGATIAAEEARSRVNAETYISASGKYDMFVSYNPTSGSISVGKQGEGAKVAWTDPSPLDIAWIGYGSDDPAVFTFCEFAPARISLTGVAFVPGNAGDRNDIIDDDPTTCADNTNAGDDPYARVDLREDHVVDMIIVDRSGQNFPDTSLEDAVFLVGGCTTPLNLAMCGTPITSDEDSDARQGNDERVWIARSCQDFLVGRYVIIQRMFTNRELTLCEVQVFGHKITDAERATLLPTCSFQDTEYTVLEGTSSTDVTTMIAPPFQYYACAAHGMDVIDGTAVDDTDFAINSGTIQYATPLITSTSSRTVNVAGGFDDTVYTGDKSFSLELAYLSGCTIGSQNNATVTIIDNDPLFTFYASKFTVAEDIGTFDLQIIRAGYTQVAASVMLDYNSAITSTASSISDFTTENSLPFQVDFDIDETVKIETITIVSSDAAELTETINFELQLVGGSDGSIDDTNGTTTVCIEDTEGATFSLADTPDFVLESDGVYYVVVTRSGYSEDAGDFVNIVTSGDTATEASSCISNEADYEALSSVPVPFASNQPTAQVGFSICPDSEQEDDETFQIYLNLASPFNSGVFIAPGQNVKTITIIDDDYEVSLTSSTYIGSEEGRLAEVTVSRTRSGGDVDFVLLVGVGSADTASPGSDFQSNTIQGTIPDGELSETVSIDIIDDNEVESIAEFFTVRLSSVTVGIISDDEDEAVITIIDNDGTYSLVLSDTTISENAVQIVATVTRGGALVNRIGNVRISTASLGAQDGIDYEGIDETLVFAVGQVSQSRAIRILDNFITDANTNRQFRVYLSDSDSVLDPDASDVTVIIEDNDEICSFQITALEVDETDGVAEITVIRDGNSDGTCTVLVVDETAINGEDYIASTDEITINFLREETQKVIFIGIRNDGIPEPDERFIVSLAGSNNGVLNQIIVTINDVSGIFRFDSSAYTIRESAGSLQITVLNTGNQDTVGLTSRSPAGISNAAFSPQDFLAVNLPLTFASGQFSQVVTITIVNDDIINEGLETFELVLSNGEVATVTIIDDDDEDPGPGPDPEQGGCIPPCLNEGVCIGNDICVCPPTFFGDQCQLGGSPCPPELAKYKNPICLVCPATQSDVSYCADKAYPGISNGRSFNPTTYTQGSVTTVEINVGYEDCFCITTSSGVDLSPGKIAGIAVGSIGGVLVMVLICISFMVIQMRRNAAAQQPRSQLGFGYPQVPKGFGDGNIPSNALVNNPVFNDPFGQSLYSPYGGAGDFGNGFFLQQQQQQQFF